MSKHFRRIRDVNPPNTDWWLDVTPEASGHVELSSIIGTRWKMTPDKARKLAENLIWAAEKAEALESVMDGGEG